jgi:TolB protein
MRNISGCFALTVMASLTACQDSANVTSPEPNASSPQFLINDAAHGGNPHFYFLPPLVSTPHPTGTFDPHLKPEVRVCPLPSCGPDLVTLVTGQGPEQIHVAGEGGAYLVNWHTRNQNLALGLYRLRVYVGIQLLGYLDFEIVSNSGRAQHLPAGVLRIRETHPLLVKFRIEEGALAQPSNGRIAFVSDRDGNHEIYVMNPDGKGVVRFTFNPGEDENPEWSSDGTKITFSSSRDGYHGIYFMNADGTGVTRVTPAGMNGFWPTWSPDGSQIAFSRSVDVGVSLYVINADGTNLHRITTPPGAAQDMTADWSPDGSRIAFVRSAAEGSAPPLADVYLVNPDGSGLLNLTHHTELAQVCCPAWSPDGQKIAYATDELSVFDNSEIFVMNADGSSQANLTNDPNAFDYDPAWSPDGQRLVFTKIVPNNFEVFVMNADGSDQANVSNNPSVDYEPAWGQ